MIEVEYTFTSTAVQDFLFLNLVLEALASTSSTCKYIVFIPTLRSEVHQSDSYPSHMGHVDLLP